MGGDQSKPYWHNDQDHPQCEKCDGGFSLTTRRHHCRNCGSVCCSRCSFRKCPVASRGFKDPVRVCTDCYLLLVTNSPAPNGGSPASGSGNTPGAATAGRRDGRGGGGGGGAGGAAGGEGTNGQGARPLSPAQPSVNTPFPIAASPIPDAEAVALGVREKERLEGIVQQLQLVDINQAIVEPPNVNDDVEDTPFEVRMLPADPDAVVTFPPPLDDGPAASQGAADDLVEALLGDDTLAALISTRLRGAQSCAQLQALAAAIQRILPEGNCPSDPFFVPFHHHHHHTSAQSVES